MLYTIVKPRLFWVLVSESMERSDESEAGPEEISFAKVTKAFSKLSEIAEDKAI